MFSRYLLSRIAAVALSAIACSAALAQTTPKIKISSQTDLPRFVYPIQGSASELVEADAATFDPFERRARADLDKILADYEIADKATLRQLLGAKLDMQELAGEYQPALQTIEELRAVEEKPAAKLLTGVFAKARIEAALETGTTTGPAYTEAFTKRYRSVIEALPWDVVQDSVKAAYAGTKVGTKAGLIGELKTELDPPVQKSGGLDNGQAWNLIGARNYLRNVLPLKDSRVAIFKAYIGAHNVEKPDIWAAREVTLSPNQHLKPVLVAIWDSGIDVSLFPKQLYTDSKPTVSGTHGLSFGKQGYPEKFWIDPLTPEQQAAYPEFRNDIKGFFDLQNGIDSPDAEQLQKKFASYSPEQMHQRQELDLALGHFVHGTHCAGIAVRGNPAARLVVARFDDDLPYLPFPPTIEYAERMKADFLAMSNYFKSRHVRVVNMSWGDEVDEFETWLSRTGGGQSAEERKKRAAELFAIWRSAVEGAIKNAPGTLFVTAAGNSDSDAGFLGDVPASLHLPNLIAVGAVNQAGDETSFTSSGDTVVVHANGYNVDSFVPGGARARLSGTSMASPNVVNLAAKLFALDPSLTPEKAIQLIRAGATTSDDGRRHLIDETRSVALLKEQSH